MRVIEAAALIDSAIRERGVEVESVDYLVPEASCVTIECRVNFVSGAPLVLLIDLSAPTTTETLPRDTLSKVLAPLLAVH